MSGPTTTATATVYAAAYLPILVVLAAKSTHAGLCDLKDCPRVTAYIEALLQ